MLCFGKIRWKNLLSTGNSFTEVDLGATGTTLIVGANGEGKSTLLDALSYVLYGKPFRKVSKSQIINSINKRDLLVECEFSIGERSYLVRRGMKPNVFEVWVDGSMLNQDSTLADQQDYLERYVLKMNHRACMQVVILGSASFVPFMELPASHRREVLEDILDVKVIGVMAEALKYRWGEITQRARDLQHKSLLLSEKLVMAEKHHASKKRTAEERAAYHADNLYRIDSRMAELSASGMEKISEAKKLETERDPDVSDKLSAARSRFYSTKAKIEEKESRLGFFSGVSVCPSCEREVPRDHAESARTKLSDEVESLSAELEALKTEMEKLSADEREELGKRDRVAVLRAESAIIKRELESLAKSRKAEETAAAMVAETGSQDVYEIEQMKLDITAVNSDLSAAVNEQAAASVLAASLKDGGVKTRILDRYVPVVNSLINKFLAELDFYVEFELDSEFNEKIRSRHRDEFSYHSFSEGEKMRIDLAILFAWRAVARARNSAATNVVIMDEIFDSSLDPTGAEELMKMITRLTGDTGVFIISHRGDQIADRFDRVIRFVKHKNFSTVVN